MKQVLQDLQTGAVVVMDTPDPAPAPGRVLVRVRASLLNAGTESAQVAKARQSLFANIRQKPDFLRKGLEELRERVLDGIREKIASNRVAGIDPSPGARQRALANGCDLAVGPAEALDATLALSGGAGADAVIICAATAESSPVEMAGKIARSRGRVVMVGATGMNIPREEYFQKELSFTLSRSYGPGRYDSRYEEEGHDYPIDHVRFTEQRKLRAFLELVQKQQVNPALLTTHRFALAEAPAAYALLNDRSVDRAGIVLEYASLHAAPEKILHPDYACQDDDW